MNSCTIHRALCALTFLIAASVGAQNSSGITAEVQAVYGRSEAIYLDLHQHPELSFRETETAALPSLHSSQFAPDREPTIKTAILTEVLALRELMPAGRGQ